MYIYIYIYIYIEREREIDTRIPKSHTMASRTRRGVWFAASYDLIWVSFTLVVRFLICIYMYIRLAYFGRTVSYMYIHVCMYI